MKREDRKISPWYKDAMDLAFVSVAKKVKATALLLCASLLFAAPAVDGAKVAPLDVQEAQIWKKHGFSPEDAADSPGLRDRPLSYTLHPALKPCCGFLKGRRSKS